VRAVFLVPRRADNGHRDALWTWARARWERYFPEIPVFEGHHTDGPFNRSRAINTAAELAGDWDLGIVIDADVFAKRSQLAAALETAVRTGRVTWAHRRWRGLHEDWTRRILADATDLGAEVDAMDVDLLVERTNPLSWSCCMVIPRPVFDDMGGFDERFRGWGFEDMAAQSLIVGLYGHERIEADIYHLWHPRSSERITKGESRATATPEYVTNARLGRRYMYALRRDHAKHDRGETPASEDERQRDMANLVADDAKYTPVARRLGLPDWDGWWPTLEELRDGAKAARSGDVSTITAIVRTGGEEASWPERSAYLRRSLASFAEHVRGNVVQRVVYSDWAGHRPELDAIAAEHGFYVVGEGHHGYTTAVQRLWRYIRERARGEFLFLAEDDFLYLRDVELRPMAEALRADDHLAQVALLRAPFYPREFADGVLGWPAESFEPRDVTNGHGRLEHRNFWTMNPSLFRRKMADRPWPAAPSSERVFGDLVLRDKRARFALWGSGEPWIEHIGAVRADPVGASY